MCAIFVGYLKLKVMKNATIYGVECTIDMIEQTNTNGRLVWNHAQTAQEMTPNHTTVKLRVICKTKELAEMADSRLIWKSNKLAEKHGCTAQHSGGMTNMKTAKKFGMTFHGENSAICAAELLNSI